MEQQPLGLRFFRILCDSPSICGVQMEGEPPASPPVEQDWVSLSSASGTVCAVLLRKRCDRVNSVSNGSHGQTHTHMCLCKYGPGVQIHTHTHTRAHTHTHTYTFYGPLSLHPCVCV